MRGKQVFSEGNRDFRRGREPLTLVACRRVTISRLLAFNLSVVATGSEILLTKQQRSDLRSIARSRALPAGYVFRAKLILLLAEGSSYSAIKRQLQTTAPTIIGRKRRFRQADSRDWTPIIPARSPLY